MEVKPTEQRFPCKQADTTIIITNSFRYLQVTIQICLKIKSCFYKFEFKVNKEHLKSDDR